MQKLSALLVASLMISIVFHPNVINQSSSSVTDDFNFVEQKNFPDSSVEGIAEYGNTLYVATLTDGIRVVDISNPTNPVDIQHLNFTEKVSWIFTEGNRLYFNLGYSSFAIYDITTPTNPVLLSTFALEGSYTDLFVNNGFLYQTQAFFGFHIYDLNDPLHPTLLSSTALPMTAYQIYSNDNLVFIENRDSQVNLSIFDLSSKINPVNVANITLPYGLGEMNSYNSTLYVSILNYGLWSYDFSTPGQPVKIETITSGYTSNPIYIIGTQMHYLSNGYFDTYQIYDLTNSSHPVLLNSTNYSNSFGSGGCGVTDGSYSWLGYGPFGIVGYEINSTSSVTEISSLDWASHEFIQIKSYDPYFLVLSRYEGLLLMNQSNYAILHAYNPDIRSYGFQLDKQRGDIYLITQNYVTSLGILNKNFEVRQQLSMSDVDDSYYCNQTLYLEHYNNLGVTFYNTSDPYNLVQVRHLSTSSSFNVVYAFNQSIIFIAYSQNFEIWKLYDNGTNEMLYQSYFSNGIDEFLRFGSIVYFVVDDTIIIYNTTASMTGLQNLGYIFGPTNHDIKDTQVVGQTLYVAHITMVRKYDISNITGPILLSQSTPYYSQFSYGMSVVGTEIYTMKQSSIFHYSHIGQETTSSTSSSLIDQPTSRSQSSSSSISDTSSRTKSDTSSSSQTPTSNNSKSTSAASLPITMTPVILAILMISRRMGRDDRYTYSSHDI